MHRLTAVILIICLFTTLPLPLPAAPVDPDEAAISLGNLLRNQIVERFQNFRDKIKIGTVSWQDKMFRVDGSLTAENGLPMDLLAQFLEALEGTGLFQGVIPTRIVKVEVDDPTRIAFNLNITVDPGKIPVDLTRESGFRFVVPADRYAPTEVLIMLQDATGEQQLERRVCKPGEGVDLKFRCQGKARLSISLDSVPYKTFDLP